MLGRWAAGSIVTLAVAGCGGEEAMTCTGIGCGPPLVVQFEPALVEEGRWTLAASDGAAMGRCVIEVPTSPQSCFNYQADAPIQVFPHQDDGRGLLGFEVHFRGPEPPPSLTVSLARGDEAVAEMTAQIEYEVSHPNGPDCGACYHGGMLVFELPTD